MSRKLLAQKMARAHHDPGSRHQRLEAAMGQHGYARPVQAFFPNPGRQSTPYLNRYPGFAGSNRIS